MVKNSDALNIMTEPPIVAEFNSYAFISRYEKDFFTPENYMNSADAAEHISSLSKNVKFPMSVKKLLDADKGYEALNEIQRQPELFREIRTNLYPDSDYMDQCYDEQMENLETAYSSFLPESCTKNLVLLGKNFGWCGLMAAGEEYCDEARDMVKKLRRNIQDIDITIIQPYSGEPIYEAKMAHHDAFNERCFILPKDLASDLMSRHNEIQNIAQEMRVYDRLKEHGECVSRIREINRLADSEVDSIEKNFAIAFLRNYFYDTAAFENVELSVKDRIPWEDAKEILDSPGYYTEVTMYAMSDTAATGKYSERQILKAAEKLSPVMETKPELKELMKDAKEELRAGGIYDEVKSALRGGGR